MKKTFLSLVLVVVVVFSSVAQLTFSADTATLVLENGVPHKASITVSNSAGYPIEARWSLISSTLNDNDDGDSDNSNNWALQFCECNTCYSNDFSALPYGAQCSDPLADGSSVEWYLTADPNGQVEVDAEWVIQLDNLTDNIRDTLVFLVRKPNSISKVTFNAKVWSFPNPANDVIEINYQLTNVNTPVLTVYNITGMKIASFVLNSLNGKLSVPTSDLESGMYFYTIEEEGQRFFIQRFNVLH